MQRYMIVFTTVCCFILAGINLYLNYRLYNLARTKAEAQISEANASEGAAVFSSNVDSIYADGFTGKDMPPVMADAKPSEPVPLYFLGTKDGYITVFYGPGGGTAVKEVTGLPANALPFDEKLRLSQQIPVYDEKQLAKLLQDYGS